MGFVLSPEAAEDLIAIRDYIARRGSPISADRWVIRLRDVCRELGKAQESVGSDLSLQMACAAFLSART